jgi:hypothetical protein
MPPARALSGRAGCGGVARTSREGRGRLQSRLPAAKQEQGAGLQVERVSSSKGSRKAVSQVGQTQGQGRASALLVGACLAAAAAVSFQPAERARPRLPSPTAQAFVRLLGIEASPKRAITPGAPPALQAVLRRLTAARAV